MMHRRLPLLITLPALLGLLHTAAMAGGEAPPEVAARTGPGPTAADVDIKSTLDELTPRLQQLNERASDTARLAQTMMRATQRIAELGEASAADVVAVGQLLTAVRDHIAELDASRAEDGAIIARLQAELDAARAESRALGERFEASRRRIEELSAGLAAAVADLPKVAAAGPGGPGPCDGSIEAERGDTLITLARRCETTLDALMKANPDIKDPRLLRVGQKIALPAS